MQTAPATATELPTPQPLDARTQLALSISGVAIALGILADLLLRITPWGINFPLWISALVGSTVLLGRQLKTEFRLAEWPWLILAVLFALGCAWRDSAVLKSLDIAAVIVLLALTIWRRQGGNLVLGHISNYLFGFIQYAIEVLKGFIPLGMQDVQWRSLPRGKWLKLALSIVVGLILAAPFLLVFGGLFTSADAAYRKIVVDLFDINLDKAVLHIFFTAIGAWIACGYVRAMLRDKHPAQPPVAIPSAIRLGTVELGVVLTCLNLLFLSFILVQLRYFFGGAAQVEIVSGLTYAEYARRGFFELVTVAALVLPLLLLADWLLRNEPRKRAFRLLATLLVLFLFVIMTSAVQRMRLYQHEYGLTELRLYTTAFMAWLAVVFIWFIVTVLRGLRERFVFGGLVTGLLAIAILHLMNPDALIMRTNLNRAAAGKHFDAEYATSLSADGVPVLVAGLPNLGERQQQFVSSKLFKQWPAEQFSDWRSASISRLQAQAAIKRAETDFNQ